MPLNEVCEQITSKPFGTSYFRQVTGLQAKDSLLPTGKTENLDVRFYF